MCQTAQTAFNPTYDDRCVLVSPADQVAIYDGCIIRTFSHDTARRKGIGLSSLFGYRIMVDHRIHIATGNQKAKTRFSQSRNRRIVFPVRLGNDPHTIAIGFQETCDNGMPKGRMIHIGIPAYIDKIQPVYAASFHIFF